MGCLKMIQEPVRRVSCKIVNDIDERFRRKGDRRKTLPRADKKAGAFAVGAVDDMVIFDISHVQPETAEGIHRRMADDQSRPGGQAEGFAQLLDITFGIAVQKVGAMQTGRGQLVG